MENKTYYLNIKAYLEGRLDAKAMHRLEEEALDDPFLSDALEGYTQLPSSGSQLSLLQRQLEQHIARQQEEKNTFHFSWQRLSVAAAAGLMIILGAILFWMKADRTHAIAEKQVEVNVISPDSLAEIHISGQSSAVKPLNGWASYETYLKENLRKLNDLKTAGQVVVEFSVDQQGNMDHFKIIKGLDENSNREAIRLIKEGPAWEPVETPSQIQIKINFIKD